MAFVPLFSVFSTRRTCVFIQGCKIYSWSCDCIVHFLSKLQNLLSHSIEPDGPCHRLLIIHHWLIKNVSLWFPYSKRYCADYSVCLCQPLSLQGLSLQPVPPVLPFLGTDWESMGICIWAGTNKWDVKSRRSLEQYQRLSVLWILCDFIKPMAFLVVELQVLHQFEWYNVITHIYSWLRFRCHSSHPGLP